MSAAAVVVDATVGGTAPHAVTHPYSIPSVPLPKHPRSSTTMIASSFPPALPLLSPSTSLGRLLPTPTQLLASLAFAGIHAAWAVQVAYATPHLRSLGLSDGGAALAWLAGPVTGVLVQPTVGALSDGWVSRHGRRRPFVAGGAAGTAAGLLLFSHAEAVATMLVGGGSNSGGGGGGSDGVGALGGVGGVAGVAGDGDDVTLQTARVVALVGFWLADACLNMAQTPARALLVDGVDLRGGDVLPVCAAVATCSAVGAAGGYAIAAAGGGVRVAYAAVAVTVVAAAAVTVGGVRERGVPAAGGEGGRAGGGGERPAETPRPAVSADGAPDPPRPHAGAAAGALPRQIPAPHNCSPPSVASAAAAAALPLSTPFLPRAPLLPSALLPAFFVQALTYVAIFSLYIYATDWGGALLSPPPPDPSSSAYAHGVRAAIVGLLSAAGVAAVTAAALPAVTAAVGVRAVWAAVLAGFAAALAAAPAVRGRAGLTALLSVTGVPMGVAATLPWAAAAATAVARRDGSDGGGGHRGGGGGGGGGDGGCSGGGNGGRGGGRADATGRILGIFNLSQCIPNMLVSLASAGLVRRLGAGAPGLARVLALTAVPVAVAAVGVACMAPPAGLDGGGAAHERGGSGAGAAVAKDVEWDGGGGRGGRREDDDADGTDGEEDVEVLVGAPRELGGRSVAGGSEGGGGGAPPAG